MKPSGRKVIDMLHHLVCVRGKDTFGLSLWEADLSKALAKARRLLSESGYAVHPAPQALPAPREATPLAKAA